jgi:hypothetical protein
VPSIPTPPEGIDAQLAAWRAAGLEISEGPSKPAGYSLTAKKKSKNRMPSKMVEPGFDSGPGWVEFTIPLKLESPNKGGHAVKKWMFGQAAKHRRALTVAFAKHIESVSPFVRRAQNGEPVRCVITRLGHELDDDNLAGCAKQLRDAVALYHGVGDGSEDPIRWVCRQEARAFDGVKVRLEMIPVPDLTADLKPEWSPF